MYAFGETYDGAMNVPIEIRKWLIKRWNKQKEQENKADAAQQTPDTPLTPAERIKMIKRAEQTPISPADFMSSRRNQKGP